ncbi:hypothetical protein F5880DRAFT_102727 [Lentinula raphanica]|nr:hypothetical protein F5880DRAFT_102727 [Lentinula raphanica]
MRLSTAYLAIVLVLVGLFCTVQSMPLDVPSNVDHLPAKSELSESQRSIEDLKLYVKKYPQQSKLPFGFHSSNLWLGPLKEEVMREAEKVVEGWVQQEFGTLLQAAFRKTPYPHPSLQDPIQFYAYTTEGKELRLYIGGVSTRKENGRVLGIMPRAYVIPDYTTEEGAERIYDLVTSEKYQIQLADMEKVREFLATKSKNSAN